MAEALNLKNEYDQVTRSGNGRGFKSLRARHKQYACSQNRGGQNRLFPPYAEIPFAWPFASLEKIGWTILARPTLSADLIKCNAGSLTAMQALGQA